MFGIIFDFNGTMIFDKKLHNESWREFIRIKTGRIASDEELNEHMHGRNAGYILSHFLQKELSKEEASALEEEKELIYRKMCLKSDDFKLADGLVHFLDELKNNKILYTIATASGFNNVKFFFENLKLDRWFNINKTVYNDGNIKGKPEPDIFLKAADKIGVNIGNCIIFEDSKSGIQAAVHAKAKKVIGVSSMLCEEELINLGASFVIKDYENISLSNLNRYLRYKYRSNRAFKI